ncbi:MAG: hypothetical protein ACI80S_001907 [Pseudohongiellaceae bacterium]|jgi:hypothetical protein
MKDLTLNRKGESKPHKIALRVFSFNIITGALELARV